MMTRTRKTIDALLPDNLLAEILLALPVEKATTPSPTRRATMKQSLLKRIDANRADDAAIAAAEMRIVRAREGQWIAFAENVDMKVLHDDGDTRTWLARFRPGGTVQAHLQTGDEEAYVLEGWCYVDRQVMRKGDYQLVPKGARHGKIVSPEGCLVFVRSHSAHRRAAELAAAR